MKGDKHMPNPPLEKLIMNCEIKRIASPFQCLSLKEKVLQYLLTSGNILFGQKLEQAMRPWVGEKLLQCDYKSLLSCVTTPNLPAWRLKKWLKEEYEKDCK